MRVLIVRTGAMGDVVHALPAVTALRMAHPEWMIDWALDPRWSPLLRAASELHALGQTEAMPLLNRIHSVTAKQWGRQPFTLRTAREIAALRRGLRAQQYDVCIDVQGSVRSAVIGRMAGAKRLVGDMHPREAPARWLYSQTVQTSQPHVIEQVCEIVGAAVDEPLVPVCPLLPVDAAAEAWCGSLLEKLPTEKFVVLTPGAGWGAKRWPADRFGLVAAGLAEHGYAALVNAGPGEEDLAQQVVNASKGAALAVPCDIGQLASLLRRASLFIGGDTGPLHLAAALQRPVVGIYGPTDPARNGPYWGAASGRSVVLRNRESRRDHARRSEPEAGLLTVTAQDVLDSALALLQESPEAIAPQENGAG